MNSHKSGSVNSIESQLKGSLNEIPTETEKNNSLNINFKSPTNALSICAAIMHAFEETDLLHSPKVIVDEIRLLTSLAKSKKFHSRRELIDDRKIYDLMDANINFTYFLLNVTNQEFQKSYTRFLKQFDSNSDFHMDEQEFMVMLRVLCKKENIGKTKLSKCFSKVVSTYSRTKRLADALYSNSKEELGSHLVREIFWLLRDKSDQKEKVCIDNLKFLPIGIAFFSEDIKKKLEMREEVFQNVSGINRRGEKINSNQRSLLVQFESFGMEYREYDSASLSFKQIQKALIIFKNSCTWDFDFKQIDIVLKELKNKYKYDNFCQDLNKPPKFNKKFITYLSYLVCMNFSCQNIARKKAADSHSLIVEEYVLWNSLAYARTKLNPAYIRNSFSKYVQKKLSGISNPGIHLGTLTANYLKKILPGIHKKHIENIVNTFRGEDTISLSNDIDEFGDNLFGLIMEEAETKLLEYFTYIYDKLEPNHKANILEKHSIFTQSNSMRDLEKENIAPNQDSYINRSRKLRKGSGQEELTTRKENLHTRFDEDESQIKSEISVRKLYKEEKVKEHLPKSLSFTDNDRKRASIDRSASKFSYTQEESKLVHQRSFTQENSKPKFMDQQKRKKNIVSSCYIMGAFLEKAAQSQNLTNERKILVNASEESLMRDDSFISNVKNKKSNNVSRITVKEKSKEENSKPRPIDMDEKMLTYEQFNHEKLVFIRKIKIKENEKNKARLCDIECCMM